MTIDFYYFSISQTWTHINRVHQRMGGQYFRNHFLEQWRQNMAISHIPLLVFVLLASNCKWNTRAKQEFNLKSHGNFSQASTAFHSSSSRTKVIMVSCRPLWTSSASRLSVSSIWWPLCWISSVTNCNRQTTRPLKIWCSRPKICSWVRYPIQTWSQATCWIKSKTLWKAQKMHWHPCRHRRLQDYIYTHRCIDIQNVHLHFIMSLWFLNYTICAICAQIVYTFYCGLFSLSPSVTGGGGIRRCSPNSRISTLVAFMATPSGKFRWMYSRNVDSVDPVSRWKCMNLKWVRISYCTRCFLCTWADFSSVRRSWLGFRWSQL